MSAGPNQSCDATYFSPWIGFKLEIPAEHIKAAIKNPSAVKAALELGRLDYMSSLLAAIGVLIAIFGLIGYLNVRFSAKRVAEDEARATARESAAAFLNSDDGMEVIKQALRDPKFLASFQEQLTKLGLTNSSDAGLVDSEPEFTDANGHNGSDR